MKALVSILMITSIFVSCSQCPSYYSYQPPKAFEDGIPAGTMMEVGMDTTRLNPLMDCIYANKFDQVHSVLIYKDGKLVFEEYLEGNIYQYDGPYYYGERIKWHKDSLHMIMSCTKSVTSAIVGIAVDKGYLKVSDPIFKYLPDHQRFKKGGKENITIEHLLTMTSGFEWDEWHGAHSTLDNDIDKIYFQYQKDPLAFILGRELVSTPGEEFTYSGANMILLGEIIRNATGQDIHAFGKEHLFDPLGIERSYWYQFESGAYACDGFLKLTPRSMLKIGITFLNEGKWNGQQIISKDWVEKSSTQYKNNSGIDVPLDDQGRNAYGYTWWINDISGGGNSAQMYYASGWGGQEVIVIPKYDMVVVFTGGNYAVKKHIHKMLEKYILPAVK